MPAAHPPYYYDPAGDTWQKGGSGGGAAYRGPGGSVSGPLSPSGEFNAGPGQVLGHALVRRAAAPFSIRRRLFGDSAAAAPESYSAGGGMPNVGTVGDQFWNQNYGTFQTGTNDIGQTNRLGSQIIGGAGTGAFDPYGDPRLAAILRELGVQYGGARERAAVTGASLDAPNDPALWAQARMNARQGAYNETQRATGEAQLAQATQAQQYIRELFNMLYGSNLGLQRQNNQGQWQANQLASQQGGGLGDALGGLLGRAAGAWLSPGGLFKGA